MACSKYTLTNTGSTIVNFNYQRCDDAMWEYQVELTPNQTKNIWLLNDTYSTAFPTSIVEIDLGVFPPLSITPTPTPTVSITPSNSPTPSVTPSNTGTVTPTPTDTPSSTSTPTPTATNTPTVTQSGTPNVTSTPTGTPTNTETPTPTPTNTSTPSQTPTDTPSVTPTQTPTSPLQVFYNVTSGATSNEACETSQVQTELYGLFPIFDNNTQFYNDPSGVVVSDMSGFYSNQLSVIELNSTGAVIGSFNLCSSLPTPTQTPTSTSTPTPTPTVTQTPTQTFAWYTYSLGTGATANDACLAFSASPQTIYGSIAGGVGPNVGEYLYETTGRPLTDVVPNGFYSNGTAWYQVTGGLGQITSSDPNGCI
jgi:hypothetical protein